MHFSSGGSIARIVVFYPPLLYVVCEVYLKFLKKSHRLFWSHQTGSMNACEDKPMNEFD